MGDTERGALAGCVTPAGVDDDVGILSDQPKGFRPHRRTRKFDAGVSSARRHSLVAEDGEVGGGLLIIGIDQQQVMTSRRSHHGQVGGDRGFPRSAFDAADHNNHPDTYLMSA